MGYINPLLKLPAAKAIQSLPLEQRWPLAVLFRQLRAQANVEAEIAWKRRKGPMAAYWRAVATYARHTAHALGKASVVAGAWRGSEQEAMRGAEHGGQREVLYRHIKTGGIYAIICSATRESDGELLVVYRNAQTGERWVRPATEFNDGRFERVDGSGMTLQSPMVRAA